MPLRSALPLACRRDTFDDFHVHGASAPEWNQRYAQLSGGEMRSRLLQVRSEGMSVFRKWMSERVVQQGGIPRGAICFAVLATPLSAMPRMQGRELLADRLIVLRGGDEFAVQRPPGMALLAATFDAEDFHARCEAAGWSAAARALLRREAVDGDPAAMHRLRRWMALLAGAVESAGSVASSPSADADPERLTRDLPRDAVIAALREALESALPSRQSVSQASASALVARCHALVLAGGDAPPDIEQLCKRLRTSRRTLQNSFRAVADTTPVQYLRGVRLNAVRAALLASGRGAVAPSVTEAALACGFTHLGRFAGDYKALFGESPSDALRRAQRGTSLPPR